MALTRQNRLIARFQQWISVAKEVQFLTWVGAQFVENYILTDITEKEIVLTLKYC